MSKLNLTNLRKPEHPIDIFSSIKFWIPAGNKRKDVFFPAPQIFIDENQTYL
jgi:hypothetical protein